MVSIKRLTSLFVGTLVVFILWALIIRSNLVSSVLLPWPNKVLSALLAMLYSVSFWRDLTATMFSWILSVILGCLFGTILGITIGINRFVWDAVSPWVEFVRALPSVVLIPLVSLFIGVGQLSRIISATIVVIVLMIATIGTGLRSLPADKIRLIVAWKATFFQKLIYFQLPSALSYMVVSLKAAIPLALVVTVAADMLTATESGLGRIIMDSLAVFDAPRMYAAILVLGILGYFSSIAANQIEELAIHWSGK